MGALGGHNSIDNIFKRDKTSGHPFIMGKAIPQMGPTAADTSLKEFSTELEQSWFISLVSKIIFSGEWFE